MNENKISSFMLERYRLGELKPEDEAAVNEALLTDKNLGSLLEKLDESDQELRQNYPFEYFHIEEKKFPKLVITDTQKRFSYRKAAYIGLAALLLAGILLPVLFIVFTRNIPENSGPPITGNGSEMRNGTEIAAADRSKGSALPGSGLSVYLKSDNEILIGDKAVLSEGNTVQLAYTTPAGGEYYGVIFSIDGRSVVTMHYPYRLGQSSLLASGKRTFLTEAYTLDDAPDFELFVMVISDSPLDAGTVLEKARELVKPETAADDTQKTDLQSLEGKSRGAFENYDVEIVTVLKK